MCGRFALENDWLEILELFQAKDAVGSSTKMPQRYNIAPTQPIVVVVNQNNNDRHALLVRWGFVPNWVKDPNEFTLLINARSETAIEKPSFKSAMRHRRVLIPMSGFYEWQRFGKGKGSQPYWVKPAAGGLVAIGGLMETWSGADGTEIDTACILTTAANDSFAPIHHRLPVVIQPEDFHRWLDCKTQEPRDVVDLMQPVPDGFFEPVPVSSAVNKVANNQADIQNRVEPILNAEPSEPRSDNQMSLF